MPVVERSVTIAGISTRELVLKDYVTEQHEEQLRRAGQLMSRKLAGSLALVTCKEPLKSNLAGHIRSLLTEFGFSEVCVYHISNLQSLTCGAANGIRTSGRSSCPGQPRYRVRSN